MDYSFDGRLSIGEILRRFRHKLGLVFDDNLGTRQWYNIADWVIVFMILLSSVEIFFATLPVGARVMKVLDVINEVTLWFFIVEVSLRIWAAPEQSPRFKGLVGRVRYCCTFYGFIDFVSTYPFLIQYFFPLSLGALRILRTARIIRVFRITRYASSFNLLYDSIKEKRNELLVSMQFLVIVTFILSIMLYVYEHDAQPDVYDDGLKSVVWSFAQYIGDPGQFADTPPITLPGRVIACIIGVLGIAIVAVPAGILGAGFTEAIEERNKKASIKNNSDKLRNAFQRKLDRPSGFQVVMPINTVTALQAKLCMTIDDIVEAVNSDWAPHFRLVNTASSIPMVKQPVDTIAVEHFVVNRSYGCLIDRGSPVTIVSPSSYVEMGIGNWAFYLAAIGGFNYISREVGDRALVASYFQYDEPDSVPGLTDFLDDLRRLLSRENAWSLTTLVSSGALEPEYPTQVHFQIGGRKGDDSKGGDGLFVADAERYESLYNSISSRLKKDFGIETDHQKYHDTSGARIYLRRTQMPNKNNVIVRVEWYRILWCPKRILLAKAFAEEIWRSVLGKDMPEPDMILKKKEVGFDGYV